MKLKPILLIIPITLAALICLAQTTNQVRSLPIRDLDARAFVEAAAIKKPRDIFSVQRLCTDLKEIGPLSCILDTNANKGVRLFIRVGKYTPVPNPQPQFQHLDQFKSLPAILSTNGATLVLQSDMALSATNSRPGRIAPQQLSPEQVFRLLVTINHFNNTRK